MQPGPTEFTISSTSSSSSSLAAAGSGGDHCDPTIASLVNAEQVEPK